MVFHAFSRFITEIRPVITRFSRFLGWDQAELGTYAGNGVLVSWSSAGTRNGELAAKERREHKGDEFNREPSELHE